VCKIGVAVVSSRKTVIYCYISRYSRHSQSFTTEYLQVPPISFDLQPAGRIPVGPGEPWERISADPGMDFFLKIPVGKDPGNLRVHPCPALSESDTIPFIHFLVCSFNCPQ